MRFTPPSWRFGRRTWQTDDKKEKDFMSDEDDLPETNASSDEAERQRYESLKAKLSHANALYDRFGDEKLAKSVESLNNEMATIPQHIKDEDKFNQKLVEFTTTIKAYVTRRRSKNLPPVPDIWETVKGFEKQHDSNDLGNSSLLKTILAEARQMNIPEKMLAQAAYEAEQSV
jgi:hypothetical protein